MRIFDAVVGGALVCAWLAPASSAQTRVRHQAKHPYARAATTPRYGHFFEAPPGYSLGGPNYTTCDRINRERMLVGTCR